MENEVGVKKLQDYIRRKFPSLSDEEQERTAKNLYGLGLFLVRLKKERYTEKEIDPDKKAREPP